MRLDYFQSYKRDPALGIHVYFGVFLCFFFWFQAEALHHVQVGNCGKLASEYNGLHYNYDGPVCLLLVFCSRDNFLITI